jgi:serine/threonine-protein kinase
MGEPLARFGPYEILDRLGTGGMCHVFRARHDGGTVDCALKLLREERRSDDQIRDLFVTEADLALLLQHPNLIRTYDAGEVDDRYYIAMELMEGGTLGDVLKALAAMKIPLPPDYALFILSEILEGLHALHTATGHTGRELGLIHRDVTPHNIFLSFDGRVILGDFGVAMIQAYGDVDPGLVLGKLGYLAPEMIAMEEVDHRADVFAAGVVLWELLTGARLFDRGSDEEVMEDILEGRITRPRRVQPTLSRELEAVVMHALARKPKDRYETAEAMLYALEPLWSKKLGNPAAIASLVAAVFQEKAERWRATRRGQPAPS